MNNPIDQLFRVMDHNGRTYGVAFLVTPQVALTCNHVVEKCGAMQGGYVNVIREGDKQKVVYKALVERTDDLEDVAILTLQNIPSHFDYFVLSSSENAIGKSLYSFGYPNGSKAGIGGVGKVIGRGRQLGGQDWLHLQSGEFTLGYSGAPIWDGASHMVIGMITAINYKDENDRLGEVAYAIPSETLQKKNTGLFFSTDASLDLQNLIRGYKDEVLNDYTSYWNRFVKKTPDKSHDSGQRRPVGQAFVLSDPQNANSQSKSDSSLYHAQNLLSKKSFSRITVQSVYPSILSVFNTLVLEQKKKFALMTAEPGAGKTFSLRFLAAELAQQYSNQDDILPIFIPLYFFTDQDDLFGYIRKYLFDQKSKPGHRNLAVYLGDIIAKGRVLFLFDGINEIEDSLIQKKVLDSIYELSNSSNNICIVSNRIVSEGLPQFTPIITIRPLDSAGALECIQLYAPRHLDKIIHLLELSPRIRLLSSNPFRLKIVCELYKPDADLSDTSGNSLFPENPGKLLEKYIQELEDRWLATPTHRKQFENGRNGWQTLLGRLASRNAPAIRLEDAYLSPNDQESLLFADAIGVIQYINNQAIFIHQQIQEYFASVWLKTEIERTGSFDIAQEFFTQASWDESFYLLAGILDNNYIDQLIYRIGLVDPFLAARCVGSASNLLSSTLLDWFADYLYQGLQYANDEANIELFDKTLLAFADTGYEKCFKYLIQPGVWQSIEAGRNSNNSQAELYYQTVARFDTPDAAQFIIAQLNQNLDKSEEYWNRNTSDVYTLALARMHTPTAQQFLSEHLLDIRIFRDVVKAAGIARLQEPEKLQTLLEGTSCMNQDETRDCFYLVNQAIGQAGLTELIPALKFFKNRAETIEVLLKFDAGQEIIDDYINQQEKYLRLSKSSKDFIPFSKYTDFYYYGIEALKTWNYLKDTLGQSATDVYTDLLIHCAQTSTQKIEVIKAVFGLALLRVTRATPILKELIKRDPLLPSKEKKFSIENGKNENEDLVLIIQLAIEFLETPGSWGIFQDNAASFMLLSRQYWTKFDGELLSSDPSVLINKSRIDQKYTTRLAVTALGSKVISEDWYSETYLKFAAQLLIDFDHPNLSQLLIQRLMASYLNPHSPSNIVQTWRVTTSLVIYGSKGTKQRQDTIAQLLPLIDSTDLNLQIIGIETLADLSATEQCTALFEFLSDRTWVAAYAVVGAINRLQPDELACDLLIRRLSSLAADERFFATLALGELGRKDFIPHLLKLENDPALHVRRAMLCALALCKSQEPDVVRVIARACEAPNGWERLEAARVVGELGLVELADLLIHLLQDYDLRVVEQAVIALGKLRIDFSLPSLHLLFQNMSKNNTDYWPPYMSNARPEPFLQEKIAISIAQFRHDSSYRGSYLPWQFRFQNGNLHLHQVLSEAEEEQNRPESQVVQGLKKNELLQALIAGQIGKGSLKPIGVKRNALKPKIITPSIEETEILMKDVSQDELRRIRKNSYDPAIRLQAFKAYAQHVDPRDLWEDFSNQDPNPLIQFEIYRLRTKNNLNNHTYIFAEQPNYGIAFAQALKDDNPDLVNNSISEAHLSSLNWRKDTTLLLAKLFSQDYKVDRLINILLQQVEAGDRNRSVLATLSSLLDYNLLHRITHSIRQSYTEMNDDWWLDTIDSMVQRRAWQIIPDLYMKANQDKHYDNSKIEALKRLCNMGVYQAAELIDLNVNNYEDNLLPVMMRVELAGQTHNLIPSNWFDREVDSERFEVCNWYMIANLACETETESPPQEWVYSVAKYIYGSHRDEDWLGRGLRKWGKNGLIALFTEMTRIMAPEKLEKLCWSLMANPDQRQNYENLRSSDREAIFQIFSKDADSELLNLLEIPEWGVRLIGVCLLIQRKSQFSEHLINKIIFDSHPSLLKTLLKFGLNDNLFELASNSDQMYILFKQAIKNHLQNLNTVSRKDLINFLGAPIYHIFASELIDLIDDSEPMIVVATINSLRKMGAIEYSQRIARKQKSSRADILFAALEAALAFNDPIKPLQALKFLKHKDIRVICATVAICGIQGIKSSVVLLQNLLSNYEHELEATHIDQEWESEKYLKGVIETLRLALFMLGIEPRYSLEGLNFSLGEGMALQVVRMALLSSGNEEYFFNLHDLPYPFIMDGNIQFSLVGELVKLDFGKTSWAKPAMTEGVIDLLKILARYVAKNERSLTFLGLPFGNQLIESWKNILDEAQSSLREKIKAQLKVLDTSQTWIDTLLALRTSDEQGAHLKEKPEKLAEAIICYVIASAIIKDEEINQIFFGRFNQIKIISSQKDYLAYILYTIGFDESKELQGTFIGILEHFVDINENDVRDLVESKFFQTARIATRLCVTKSFLENFSSLTLSFLQAADLALGKNKDWLIQYQDMHWFELFSSDTKDKRTNLDSLSKTNPFPSILTKLVMPNGIS